MDIDREIFYDNVITSCEISCSRCFHKEKRDNIDEYYFVNCLISEGWIVKKYRGINEIVCPDCIKKYFTKRNNKNAKTNKKTEEKKSK